MSGAGPDTPPPGPTEGRAWQRMLSGRRLDLLAPDPADIDIRDIAHGLARVARWNGQTLGAHAFSVAQHCLIVEQIAGATPSDLSWRDQEALAALLHDAPEYVIGDLISPFKSAIGLDYKAFELRLLGAIHRRYALPFPVPEPLARHIKAADRIAAYYEATRLAGFGADEGRLYFGPPPALEPALVRDLEGLEPWPTHVAQARFLARCESLGAAPPGAA